MSETPRGAAWSAAWGVVAVVLGTGAVATWIAAVSPHSAFPAWPGWILSAATLVTLYMCFAFLCGMWPANRTLGHSQRTPHAQQSQPPHIELIPEQAGEWLRLGLLNRGAAAEYTAEVTGIIDPLGRKIGQQHWPIPWLEDGSSDPKRILTGQTRMLDFARYDMAAVNAELSTGHGGRNHWWFSSVPTAINASYYNLRSQADLEEQHFILAVRIINANSGKYFDRQFKVGVHGSRLVCELAEGQCARRRPESFDQRLQKSAVPAVHAHDHYDEREGGKGNGDPAFDGPDPHDHHGRAAATGRPRPVLDCVRPAGLPGAARRGGRAGRAPRPGRRR